MFLKLSELEVGIKAVLDDYEVSPLHKKLLTMGLVPGQEVSVLRKLPLHGSLYVRIDNRNVALRYEEANQISVRA